MSRNFTSPCVDDFTYYNVPFFISWITLSILVIAQSLLIICIIWLSPKLHTNTNMFILSVTVSDIFLAVSCLITAILNRVFSSNMVANPILWDTLMLGVSYSTLMLSMNQMGVIAADRYINIVHPFVYIKHVTRVRVLAIILCYWILTFVYGAIPLVVYTNTKYHQHCILSHPPIEYFLIMSIPYGANLFVILILYIRIANLAYRRKKAAQARQLSNVGATKAYRKYEKPAWKSVKFCAIMCGIYVICTGPSGLVSAVNLKFPIPINVYGPLQQLYLVHSFLNFFVFLNMNSNFKEAVIRMFVDMKRRCI